MPVVSLTDETINPLIQIPRCALELLTLYGLYDRTSHQIINLNEVFYPIIWSHWSSLVKSLIQS